MSPKRALRAGALSIALLSLFAYAGAAAAQELSVETELSETEIPAGESFTMQVTAVSRVSGQLQIDLPQISGLSQLSTRTSESTSMSWSNSGQKITRQKVLTVDYVADRPGTITIGPITARVGSRSASSRPVKLKVTDSGAPAAPTPAAKAQDIRPPSGRQGQLFVRYRVDNPEAYVGQQILVDLDIYARPGVDFQLQNLAPPPELEGFWREIAHQPQRLSRARVKIDGLPYDRYRAWRIALFPLKAGEAVLPPLAVNFSTGRSFFDRGRTLRRRTEALALNIKPLPSKGRPAGFSPTNVGQFKLTATAEPDRVEAGKAVMLKIKLSGRGNLSSVKLPELKEAPGFRVFPATIKDDIQRGLPGVSGSKTAEILLMPQKSGSLKIPSVRLAVFDPAEGAYKTLKTAPIPITVSGAIKASAEPAAPAAAAPAPAPAEPSAGKAAPLRYHAELHGAAPTPWRRAWFWIGLFLPPLAFAADQLLRRKRRRPKARSAADKARAEKAAVTGRLKEAEARLKAGQLAEAYTSFTEALITRASERCGAPLAALTHEELVARLRAAGAPAALCLDIKQQLQAADYARFAPSMLPEQGPELAERWNAILDALEQAPLKPEEG